MPTSFDPPLKPLVVDLLLALYERPQHGYALMKRLRSEGSSRVHTGPLYRTLRDLLDEGLVEELNEPPAGVSDDPRRGSYYAVSPEGREALGAELGRLQVLVDRGRRLGAASG